jgi:hypothetical protein
MRALQHLAPSLSIVLLLACAGVTPHATPQADAGPGVGGAGGGAGRAASGGAGARSDAGATGGTAGAPVPALTDFPPAPIIVAPTIPQNAPTLFDGTSTRAASAPCITAPASGTLMPRNWLRPQVTYTPAADENLFEITFTVPGFHTPLRVYTRERQYTLDRTIWDQLRMSIQDVAVQITVKALTLSSAGAVQLAVSQPAQSSFVLAPVDAPGKIVYWAVNNVGSLKGFGIGEEGTEDVLVPAQVSARNPSNETCIGCHAATPDGQAVGFALGQGLYLDSIAQIGDAAVGQVPAYVTNTALAAVRKLEGIPAYSPAHWSQGDRIVILSDTGDLHWIQLDGQAQGVLARNGDVRSATEPAFSHDGQTVLYVSTNSIVDGRAAAGPGDLIQVPYAAGAGGPAIPLPAASTTDYTEYYPSFSSDDALVAFTRIAGNGNVYSNADAEVFVVPAAGGTAVRLAANDAPACQTGVASPGLTNDWPKWAPDVGRANGKRYYWVTFSSKRTGVAQLYVAPLVVDAAGAVTTWPALYLWNQPSADGNHTPSWDNYQIPPITID